MPHARWKRLIAPLLLALAVAVPSAVALPFLLDEINQPPHVEGSFVPGSPNLVRGLMKPKTVPAAQADLPDDEPVIGVVMNGVARAYRVAALAPMSRHVVNDLVGGVPVTVTYCDRSDCSRTYTGEGSDPFDVWTAGFVDQLMLKLDEKYFWQETGAFTNPELTGSLPIRIMPHQRMTWKEWKQTHPQTDVFLDNGTQ